MPNGFIDKLAQSWPPTTWRETSVVLAVSGGADSVSLLRGVCELAHRGSSRLVVAHFNHRLRAEEADLDEAFVCRLSRELGLPCVVGRAEHAQRASQCGLGPEATARQFRYRFLRETAEKWGARFVATAHTADDQAETILHRILRGTGLRGLSGIPAARLLADGIALIRPLLPFRRSEVYHYLQSLGQEFRVDSSNREPRFARNRLRCDLIPKLEESFNRDVVAALIRLGSLAGQAQSLLDQLTGELVRKCVLRSDKDGVEMDCRVLAAADSLLVAEAFIAIWKTRRWPLRDMGFEQWNQLTSLAQTSNLSAVRTTLPGGVLAERHAERLRLKTVVPSDDELAEP